ncbi:3-dehydroquinate synthase [Clostridium sp. SYSU_GA19001]|uniref:3-dehydroquinate synthase n=1 Tax=Clostridium caldaquaticum TaxID=2940653 RepID=UPI0020770B3C|nr:3-dehydroquinate synthase [Clostridium caldaquaticum]MCM8711602.1 3-dehydroquinate synthase [Clostridium caldaquaticum]
MLKLTVNLPDKSYPIYIEKGIIQNIGENIKKIYKNKKIAIITDSNVEKLYGQKLENNLIKENFITKMIIIEPGEKSKSFEVLQRVCDELLEFNLTRGDLIIAFGGGVVGDLGGFAASIILRGIPFIQIPTSLLAQIDSSIGGKVAVNSKHGKNLIGSFYQPVAVFIDPDLLRSLKDRVFYDGMAEVIKYGAIRNKELFYNLLQYKTKEELLQNIDMVIYSCLSIKKDVVEKDEKDTGERMLLNFGHTIGHGIEKCFNYEKFTHGEAVAIGMAAITEASEELEITEEGTSALLKKLIAKYNLPYELPDINKTELFKAMNMDKKNIGKSMNIILLESIGQSFIKNIKPEEIEKYIKS